MTVIEVKKNSLELIFIALLAFFGICLFFYKLQTIPQGFYIDEALHGYGAYSILETGKDEYGKAFPIVFRFYASYNPSLYVYLTTIPIKIWGLTAFSVRMVSAMAGLLSVFVIYLFLRSIKVSTLGSLFYLITPWVIFQGRIGYEVVLALMLFALGCLFLWFSLNNRKWIIPAFLVLSFSTYAAFAERFMVPILILLFFIFFRKRLIVKENARTIFWGGLLLILTQMPHFYLLTTPAFFPKIGEVGSSEVAQQAEKLISIFPYSFALIMSYVKEFASQFINYFSPRTLFLAGDKDIPAIPAFYQWMIVPYLVGLFVLWKDKRSKLSRFIFLLALVSPIPASLTKDPFSAHRAMPVVLPITLIISVGLDKLIKHKFFHNKAFNKYFNIGAISVVFLGSLILLWRSYYVFLPKEKAKSWSYGYDTLAAIIKSNPNEHFVIDQARLQIPYTLLVFFLKTPPSEFQKTVDPGIKDNYYHALSFNPYAKFENLETREIIWEKDIYIDQVLVGDNLTISPEQAKEHFLDKVFEIKDPLGEIIFEGYKTNPSKKCQATNYKSQYCSHSSTF